MAITRHEAITVINDNQIAIEPLFTGIGYNAVGRCNNRGPFAIGNIVGRMEFPPAGER